MRTEYFLIPESEVTQRIINLSVSRRKEQLPRMLKRGLFLSDAYLVVEAQFEQFPADLLNYTPYSADELLEELSKEGWNAG